MQTDNNLQGFKQRLLMLLPNSEELQTEILHQLTLTLTPGTLEIFALAMPSFFRIPVQAGQWQVAFCLHFSGSALLCQREHWDCLDEVCRLIYDLAGVTEIYIRGSDLCHRCCLEDGKWIREVL